MTAAEMAALHRAAFTMPRPWTAAELARYLADPSCFALSEADGFLIGRVIVDEAELLTVAVRPDKLRQGIGRRLVSAFLTEARARGAAQAYLEVAADNPAAIGLYHGQGFAQVGRRKGYYSGVAERIDALIFSSPLQSQPGHAPGSAFLTDK